MGRGTKPITLIRFVHRGFASSTTRYYYVLFANNKNTNVYLINNQPKKWFRITSVYAVF
jgi:hypothetical protein